MNVDIYMPRCDVTFKKGPIPQKRGPVQPVKQYWQKFVSLLKCRHDELGHKTRVIEIPLWKLTPEKVDVYSKGSSLIYIPHKMVENWINDERVLFYMQMVIPSIFSIDPKGWCASASAYPIRPHKDSEQSPSNGFDLLSRRIFSNETKFAQPSAESRLPYSDDYLFFPCQIPHDETIKYHSPVTVEQALSTVIKFAQMSGQKLIIKGHPANHEAMRSLKLVYVNEMFESMNKGEPPVCAWIDRANIHTLLSHSKAVFTVNSGVGFEAILHQKPVFTFGRADYDYISTSLQGSPSEVISFLYAQFNEKLKVSLGEYKGFVNAWYQTHYDCNDSTTFLKIA